MKSFVKILFSVCVILSFTIALSCGDDEPDTPTDNRSAQEIATDTLTSVTWSVANGGQVSYENSDVTTDYPNLTISFSATNYNSTNSEGLFNASGTWNWADGTTNSVIDLNDSDKSELTIITLNNTTFRFRFRQLNDAGGTRAGIDGLAGTYELTLTR